jgi:hypothetical protein
MRWRRHSWLHSAFLLLVAASVTRPAAAQEEDDAQDQRTRIRIERHAAAEDEGKTGRSHVVFIDEEGGAQEIEGEGAGYAWFDGEGGRHFAMRGLRDGAFLGVSTTPLTPALRTHFGAPEGAGVMISKIVEDSAAFRAGLAVGDIITSVDGESVESPVDLLRSIRSHDEGDTVTVEVFRAGRVEAIAATLGKGELHGFEMGAMRGFHHPRGLPHGLEIDCAENGGDCDIVLGRHLEVCGDDEECDIDISCKDGGCTCAVNGEETDCEELHLGHRRRSEE